MAKVYGSVIREEAFRWAWIVSRAAGIPRDQSKALRLKEAVLNGLIERELLAIAAQNMGIKVTEESVDQNILDGVIYYNASVHSPIKMPSGPIPIDFRKDDGSFDFDTFKMFVNGQLQMSLPGFKNQQIKEILADRMRKIIENSVELYPNEAREHYERTSTWVKVKSATFNPFEYAKKYEFQPAEIKKWAVSNSDRIEKHYKDNDFQYKNIEKQARVRNILIQVSADAEDKLMDEKMDLAESIYKRAVGGENFAALAKKYSEDTRTKTSGGDNGFQGRGYFEEKIEDAAFGMEPGEVKGPIESDEGYQIIKVEGFREGDIPLDEVKMEIAKNLMTEEKSAKEARTDAEKLLVLLRDVEDIDEALEKMKQQDEAGETAGDEAFDSNIPSIRTSGEIRKDITHIPGVGSSKNLVSEIFSLRASGTFIDKVVEVNKKFHVIKITERHNGSDSDFLTGKDAIERDLIGEKKIALVEQWIDTQRKKAEKEGAIKIEKLYLKYPGEETAEDTED